MPTLTTNYSLNKPLVNDPTDEDLWGGQLNTNMDTLDSTIYGIYRPTVNVVTSSGNATTIDLNDGNVFKHTFTEDTTFTFSNPGASTVNTGFTLLLINDGTGRTPTWPASVDWPSGVEPILTTASETNLLIFNTYDGGTTWYGALALEALA
jgi:hypothetical protein